MNHLTRLTSLLFFLVLLTGCQTESTTTPAVEIPANPWPTSVTDIGPIHFGSTVAEANTAVGEDFQPIQPLESGCMYGSWPSAPEGLTFMVVEGKIARADMGVNLMFRSVEGIGVGSTLEEAKAAYGDILEIGRSKYGGEFGGEEDLTLRYIVQENSFGYVFESRGGVIDSWRAGLAEPIQWVEGCS